MDTNKIVDEFKKVHGAPEDWDDQGSYMQALGSFTLGWRACEQSSQADLALCADCGSPLDENENCIGVVSMLESLDHDPLQGKKGCMIRITVTPPWEASYTEVFERIIEAKRFIDLLHEKGHEVAKDSLEHTPEGLAYIPVNRLTMRAPEGLYCPHCGDLLSEHVISDRGGHCVPYNPNLGKTTSG